MTTRVRVNRGLTDPERSLLSYLAVRTVADQVPCSEEAAADALDELAGRGLMHLRGDVYDAYVTANGHVLVHCTREWLSFMATAVEDGDAPPAYGTPIDG